MNVEASLGGPRLEYLCDRFIGPCVGPAVTLAVNLQADGAMRAVPTGTLFFLAAHGGTAPAACHPLATLLGLPDPTDPANATIHATAVAEMLIQPTA